MSGLVPVKLIETRILMLRGHKVLLDRDLAELYGVEVKQLKRQVRRNMNRFPMDFMFELSKEENESLRRHLGTLKRGEHSKYLSYAFTEQGVAMISGVLNSPRAIRVNIEIMRAFVRLREMIATHKDLARKLDELEKKYDARFKIVFEAIRQLMAAPEPKEKKIGFYARESITRYRVLGRNSGRQRYAGEA